ncbi:MAG TPA: methyltransferase domain-containing protein [Actinomycetota bacterium]
MSALTDWGLSLRDWGVPDEILAKAKESPWGLPPELMRRRAERAADLSPSTSLRRARGALPDGGSVLDVGVGGGAASLPLVPPAARIVGVDGSQELLGVFEAAARRLGVETVAVLGSWPDAADRVERADVVVCSHVLYNVQDLDPFVRALDDHARRRVVVEITERHPLAWMSDLWRRFHGLVRPDHPTADDAHAALREMGLDARREDETRPPRSSGFERREDAVALVRRRLCLTEDRDEELAEALGDRLIERDGLWSAGPAEQTVVTLWWDRVT